MKNIKIIAFLLFTLASVPAFAQYPQKSADGKYNLNLDENGCMAQGYDVVSIYNNLEVKGTSSIESLYQGGKYWFSNAENKKTFDANPSKYAPLYGGFCAFAITEGNLRPIQIWTHKVTKGHLVFQHNGKALKLWNLREHHNYKKANKNWPDNNSKTAAFKINKDENLEDLRKTSYGTKPSI
jgi:YHS domain-containing protein